MNFKEEQSKKVEAIETILKEYLPEQEGYQKVIMEAMEYSVMAGGKRLRPMLMQETFRLFGGKGDIIEPFMAAIEMIHTYSLVHDDLPAMDNDDYRRGRKTTHVVYGEGMGILAGDALLNCAMETALSASVDEIRMVKALKILFRSSGTEGMIGGQVIDIKNSELSADGLKNLHLLKTGAIIRSAGVVGAIISEASEKEIDVIDNFCMNLGIAFQIQDDVLDVKGNEKDLGKPVGSDADNNKTTYVTLYGIEKSQEMVIEYTEKAKNSIKECFGEKSENLIALADYLIDRNL